MGRLGSDADLRGTVQCGQHLQQSEAGVHLLGEPAPGTVAGFSVAHGHGHNEILLPVRARPVRVQQRLESAALVSNSIGEFTGDS